MLSWLQIWYHDYSLQWMQYKCIWWGGQISKFLSVPLQVLWNVLRSCFQRNTQQISTLLHSMKDNWIHYIHDKNYKNSFSCNTLFGLTNVSITNFVHLQGLSHMWHRDHNLFFTQIIHGTLSNKCNKSVTGFQMHSLNAYLLYYTCVQQQITIEIGTCNFYYFKASVPQCWWFPVTYVTKILTCTHHHFGRMFCEKPMIHLFYRLIIRSGIVILEAFINILEVTTSYLKELRPQFSQNELNGEQTEDNHLLGWPPNNPWNFHFIWQIFCNLFKAKAKIKIEQCLK